MPKSRSWLLALVLTACVAGSAAAQRPGGIATRLPLLVPGAGSISAGAVVFQQRCAGCHGTEQRQIGAGPILRGVFDAAAGRIKDYRYSSSLKYSGKVWNARQLQDYLADPGRDVPGTTMAGVNLTDAAERRDVIAYLASLR